MVEQLFKVVEIAPVDEEKLEKALNEWAARNYELDRLEFVCQPGVRRPVMAYLFFRRVSDGVSRSAAADDL